MKERGGERALPWIMTWYPDKYAVNTSGEPATVMPQATTA
jgi:hypothetical protein